MTDPVNPKFIQIATQNGIHNADVAAVACREAGLPFFAACALLEKESHGLNVYGNDTGGFMAGFPDPVNYGNWRVFRWHVIDHGYTSNGVGPCQLTYKGFFLDMEKKGLKPWRLRDNMFYGFRLLAGYHRQHGDWLGAGEEYNGARSYGQDLQHKVHQWRKRFGL